MRLIFLFIFLSVCTLGVAQDFDVYPIMPDDKLQLAPVQYGMSADEFEVISRNLRMKDMMYAMIVPGYVHFQANDNLTGYTLVGLRGFAYASMFGIGLNSYAEFKSVLQLSYIFDKDKEQTRLKVYSALMLSSFVLIFGTYFYDWINGQALLTQRQQLIRYKYGLKFELEKNPDFFSNSQFTPTLGISLKF